MEIKKTWIILITAILILVAGYLFKGIPMLAAILVGYFFIYKAYLKYLEKQMINSGNQTDDQYY
jgi:hypothetical protein